MNISTLARLLKLAGLLFLISHYVQGQSGSSSTPSTSGAGSHAKKDCVPRDASICNLNATITDVAAPDSPAFTVLGLTSNNTTKPNSPSELASSVLNAFDDNGHFQSGAAIDVVPFLVFKAKSFSLGQYTETTKKAFAVRVLSRSSVSFATTKGTSSPDTAVRLATGLRIALLDKGDPRAAFQNCVRDLNIIINPADPTQPMSDKDMQSIKDCRTKAGNKVWNRTSLVLAGAPSWISTNGSTSNMKYNGGGIWASFGYGISDWGQFIVNGRRETGQNVVPPSSNTNSQSAGTSAFVLQDTTIAGGSFKFGRSDFNGTVAGLYIGKRTAGRPDSYPEVAFGLEKKLVEGFYLELNYRYDVTSTATSGILANLKWSFSQQPKEK